MVGHRLATMTRLLPLSGCLLRATLAVALLALCLQDGTATRAIAELRALPDYDHAREASRLAADERLDEALLVLDAGLAAEPGPQRAAAMRAQRRQLVAERESWSFRSREFAAGAWRGQGDSTPALLGAVTSDLLVFGDVRDLVIQSARGLRGEPVDPVITALSGAGILLTAWPAADGGTAVLKAARRSGALSARLAGDTLRAGRRALAHGDATPLRRIAADAGSLQRQAGAAPAIRILRGVEGRGDLARAAGFVQRPGGAFALWAGGAEALRLLRVGGSQGGAWLLRAARKGPEGVALAARSARVLARPHPLIGLTKGLYKGNADVLLSNLLRDHAAALIGLLTGWLFFELGLLGLRLHRVGRSAGAGAGDRRSGSPLQA